MELRTHDMSLALLVCNQLAESARYLYHRDAFTLSNMQGQYRTIRWQRRRCLFRHLLLADFSIYLQ